MKWVEKIKANGIYGQQAYGPGPYGHVPIAIGTTGIGREGIKLLIVTLEELYPDSVIEWDTDGVYFTISDDIFDEVEVWIHFDENIEEKFKRKLFLDIEFDTYDAGYFYKTKNYVLLKGNVVDFTGVSMHSSKMCDIERNCIQEMGRAKLGLLDENEVVKKYTNLSNFNYRDFVLSTSLGKSIKSYVGKGRNALSYRLAIAAQNEIHQDPEIGNQYFYVKTLHGFELSQTANKGSLDIEYYMDIVNKVIRNFKITGGEFKSLNTFYNTQSTSSGDEDWQFDEEEVKVDKDSKEAKKVVGLNNFY